MNVFRKTMAGLALGTAMTATFFVGNALVQDVRFARAQERVDATRAQIANVQDMAAVFKSVGRAVEPSVVKIDVKKALPRGGFLNRFRNNNDNGDQDVPEVSGTGSGVIVEIDGNTGYIVTNNHVASGAIDMMIALSDGRKIRDAKLVGTDPKSDLAVVKIESSHLIAAKWGKSGELEKGDIVLAFGSPMGFVGSMTHGIVSALGRDNVQIIRSEYAYENFIQVDAPINPGNSGGPLVNLKGEIVGINTAIASESGGFQGIGLAIPSDQVRTVYEAIKAKGRVVRGWLGVKIGDVAEAPEEVAPLGYSGQDGVLVKEIYRNTPAFGKLEPNDIITAINGKKIGNKMVLRNTVAEVEPGKDIQLSIFHAGQQRDVTVTVGEQPDDQRVVPVVAANTRNNNAGRTGADAMGLQLSTATSQLKQHYQLDTELKGAIITGVAPQSLAARAGLQEGDVITRLDNAAVASADELNEALSKKDLTSGVTLSVTNQESMRSVFIKTTDR